jgi:hypothetical protein
MICQTSGAVPITHVAAPVQAAEADAGETPHPRCLFGQRFDERLFERPRSACLVGDEPMCDSQPTAGAPVRGQLCASLSIAQRASV